MPPGVPPEKSYKSEQLSSGPYSMARPTGNSYGQTVAYGDAAAGGIGNGDAYLVTEDDPAAPPSYVRGNVGIDPSKQVEMSPPQLGSMPPSPAHAGNAGAYGASFPPAAAPAAYPHWPGLETQVEQMEAVKQMKQMILSGDLRVSVFNKHIEQEAKRLALDPQRGSICILKDDGLYEDSWEIDGLKTITKGIAHTVLANPPPADRAAAFRFKFPELGQEDLFLCIVFDTPDKAWLALEAFRQLCNVPIEQAG
jgi:hypothetical protein